MWLSDLGGHSMVKCKEEVGVEVLLGAEASGVQSPGVTQESSTSKNKDLHAGPPSVSMPWEVFLCNGLFLYIA